MFRFFLLAKNYLLIIALCICACAITGCVESSFTLADESSFPRSMTIPPGLSRGNVLVTLNLYAAVGGTDAKLVLTDSKGKDLAEVKGKMEEVAPFIYKLTVPANGVTEMIKLRPYKEHENMERNGIPDAKFYFIDDPALIK